MYAASEWFLFLFGKKGLDFIQSEAAHPSPVDLNLDLQHKREKPKLESTDQAGLSKAR